MRASAWLVVFMITNVNLAVAQVCCLPVLEKTATKTWGYCYLASEEGYLKERIDDDELRNHANQHPQSYPVCKDAWCIFSKGPNTERYYRLNEQGLVLQEKDKKFKMDHVGFLEDKPSQHVASYGLQWIGPSDTSECQVAIDVNAELLNPLCIMKVEGERELSFVDYSELEQALLSLANGKKEYMLFYKTEGNLPDVTGEMPQKYLQVLFDSKANIKIGTCSSQVGLYNTDNFDKLGFRIVK